MTRQHDIELSLITPPMLAALPITEVASWASAAGFAAIDAETDSDRDTTAAMSAAGLHLGPMRIRASLADSDPKARTEAVEIARAGIDQAVTLGVGTVWTLPRNFRNDASQRANFDAGIVSLTDLVGYAEDRGVRVAIENCPFEGQNAICTPETWDALFERVRSDALGICLDPSHCVWQGIDHLRAIREYRDRIIHIHAKDTEILTDGRYRFGVEGPQLTALGDDDGWPQHGWWRHRLPGLGLVDWNAFFTALADAGYTGVVSVEHEDPLWGGSVDRVQRGLAQARRYLSQFVPLVASAERGAQA